MRTLRHLFFVGLLLAPSSVGWAQINRDSISVKSSPRQVLGTITETSADEITLTVDGSAERVAADDVERIVRLSDDPAGLRSVRDLVRSGQLARALEEIEDVKVPAGSRDVVRQEVLYFRAVATAQLALQGTRDITEAARLVGAFLAKNSNSFHFYPACETLGDLAMALGKYDAAKKYYGKLAESKSELWKSRSSLLQGRALQLAGDFSAATKLYEQVAASTGGSSDSDRDKALAQIGQVACLAELGRHAEGVKLAEEVIARADPQDTELFARAYNALGSCYRKANQPEDAVLAYLHVDLLFFRVPDAHAEALYYLSQLWPAAGKPNEATKAKKLLNDRYASTAWGQKSK